MTPRVWRSDILSPNTKIQLYNALVMSTLLYASETWTLTEAQVERLEVFHNRNIRRIKGVSLLDRVPTAELHRMGGQQTYPIAAWLRRFHLRWIGHLARRDDDYYPKQMLFAHYVAPKVTRQPGRPLASFTDRMHALVQKMQPHIHAAAQGSAQRRVDWYALAQDRVRWSGVVKGAMNWDN
jgi:hypothetical protein